jgi:hypothetical protein
LYDGVTLHGANDIVHVALFCVAAGLWVLYLHEILFKSGKVQKHWMKRRLADLGLMVLIAVVTFLLTTFLSGLHFHHGR